MSEKKYGKCPECGAPCEVVTKMDYDGFTPTVPYNVFKYHPQPGPAWVKASEPNIKDGHYVAKFRPDDVQFPYDPVGMAFVDAEYIHFIAPSLYDIKWMRGHKELQYLQLLDESPAEQPVREVELLEFAEWAPTIAFFDEDTRLWELLKEGEFINGQFRFTTKELYILFKQQQPAEWSGEKEAIPETNAAMIEFCYRYPDGSIGVHYRRLEGTVDCEAMIKEIEYLIERAKPGVSPYFYRKEGEKEANDKKEGKP